MGKTNRTLFLGWEQKIPLPMASGAQTTDNVVSLSQWTLKKRGLNFIFPTKYGIPKSLKPVSHWPSKLLVFRKKQKLTEKPPTSSSAPKLLFLDPAVATDSKKTSMVVEMVPGSVAFFTPQKAIYKWHIYCQLGDGLCHLPPFRGTRNNH